jgi:hypothetical protein
MSKPLYEDQNFRVIQHGPLVSIYNQKKIWRIKGEYDMWQISKIRPKFPKEAENMLRKLYGMKELE